MWRGTKLILACGRFSGVGAVQPEASADLEANGKGRVLHSGRVNLAVQGRENHLSRPSASNVSTLRGRGRYSCRPPCTMSQACGEVEKLNTDTSRARPAAALKVPGYAQWSSIPSY